MENWFAPYVPAPAARAAALFARLRAEFGPAADWLARAMADRAAAGSPAFYRRLYGEPALCAALTLGYDGESLPRFAAFLADHRALLRGRVAEVGCGCGMLSAAMGRMAPAATILATDRCAAAVDAANALWRGHAPDSVRFVPALPPGDYDAVLSCRTLHENFDQSGVPRLEALDEAGGRLAGRMAAYARRLAGLVAADGALLSIERGGAGPVLLGWLLALGRCGLVLADHRALAARECGAAAEFQAMAFRRGREPEAETLRRFCGLVLPAQPPETLTGTAAEAYLLRHGGRRRCGFAVCGPDGTALGRAGVWMDDSAGEVLAFQASLEGSFLRRLPAGQAQAAEAAMAQSARQARAAGYLVR